MVGDSILINNKTTSPTINFNPGEITTLEFEMMVGDAVPIAFQRSSMTRVHQVRTATLVSESKSNSATLGLGSSCMRCSFMENPTPTARPRVDIFDGPAACPFTDTPYTAVCNVSYTTCASVCGQLYQGGYGAG